MGKRQTFAQFTGLGGLRIKSLALILTLVGYGYPAYQTYKSVNRRDTDRTRFWSIYWIIFATFVSVEWLVNFLLSWLPLYYEAKVIFVICLWYPKTKLALTIYEQVIAPFISQHEADIDKFAEETKIKLYDLMGKHASTAKDNLRIYSSKAQEQVKTLQEKAIERARGASQRKPADYSATGDLLNGPKTE